MTDFLNEITEEGKDLSGKTTNPQTESPADIPKTTPDFEPCEYLIFNSSKYSKLELGKHLLSQEYNSNESCAGEASSSSSTEHSSSDDESTLPESNESKHLHTSNNKKHITVGGLTLPGSANPKRKQEGNARATNSLGLFSSSTCNPNKDNASDENPDLSSKKPKPCPAVLNV